MRAHKPDAKCQGWFPYLVSILMLFIGVPIAACAGALSSVAALEPSAITAVAEGTSCMAAVPTMSAMKAYIDPATGEFAASPVGAPDPELPMSLHHHTRMSTEALVEQPAPGGGIKVDLDDRFFSFSTATKDRNGKLAVSHAPLSVSK
jgi:hypothetical protein